MAAFQTFLQGAGVALEPSTLPLLAVDSRYFLARGQVLLDDLPFVFTSLIEYREGTGIRVLARSRGADDAWELPLAAPLPDDLARR